MTNYENLYDVIFSILRHPEEFSPVRYLCIHLKVLGVGTFKTERSKPLSLRQRVLLFYLTGSLSTSFPFLRCGGLERSSPKPKQK